MSAQIIAAIGLALVLLLVVLILGTLNRRSVAYREQAAPGAFSAPLDGFFDEDPDFASDMATESETRAAAFTSEAADVASRAIATPPVEDTAQTAAVVSEVDVPAMGSALKPPVPGSATVYAPATTETADPVTPLVASLLEGQGELSQTELRRLELYRPQRVLESVAQLSESMAGRGKESKRSRLHKIRLHAETLRSAEGPEEPVTVEQPPSYDQAEGSAPPPVAEGVVGSLQPPSFEEAAAIPEPATERTPPADAGFWAAGDAGAELWADAPVDEGQSWQAAAAPEAHLWAEPNGNGRANLSMSELMTQPAESEQGGSPPEPEKIEQEAWSSWPVVEAELPVVETSVPVEESNSAEEGAPAEEASKDHLGALEVTISSAEDLLALPSHERCDALAFLEIPEMERLLGQSDDPELCRAIVDRLERAATPDSLRAINAILEEGDPGLQLYALNAAERLLARM